MFDILSNLQETKIGLSVGKLRQNDNTEVAALAKELVKKVNISKISRKYLYTYTQLDISVKTFARSCCWYLLPVNTIFVPPFAPCKSQWKEDVGNLRTKSDGKDAGSPQSACASLFSILYLALNDRSI